MSVRRELSDVLEQWRAWTIAEGEAIRGGDWRRIEICQSAKQQLQAAAADCPPCNTPQTQSILRELIAMEMENQRALSDLQSSMQAKCSQLDQARRLVRQLSHTYGASHAAAWQSYS